MKQWRIPEILLGALLTVAVFAVGYSASSQLTPHPQEQTTTDHSADPGAPAKEPDDKSFWVRTFNDPVAVFTAVLAVTTVLLAVIAIVQIRFLIRADGTARKAANAADLSARAAVRIELPILRAVGPELEDLDKPMPDSGAYATAPIDGVPRWFSCVPVVTVFNDGRTPAFPTALQMGWLVGQLPPQPTYPVATRLERDEIAIKAHTDGRLYTAPHTIILNDAQIAGLDSGELTLWFYLAIHYRDFMDEPHEARFCWRWANENSDGVHRFHASGDPPPGYTRKT